MPSSSKIEVMPECSDINVEFDSTFGIVVNQGCANKRVSIEAPQIKQNINMIPSASSQFHSGLVNTKFFKLSVKPNLKAIKSIISKASPFDSQILNSIVSNLTFEGELVSEYVVNESVFADSELVAWFRPKTTCITKINDCRARNHIIESSYFNLIAKDYVDRIMLKIYVETGVDEKTISTINEFVSKKNEILTAFDSDANPKRDMFSNREKCLDIWNSLYFYSWTDLFSIMIDDDIDEYIVESCGISILKAKQSFKTAAEKVCQHSHFAYENKLAGLAYPKTSSISFNSVLIKIIFNTFSRCVLQVVRSELSKHDRHMGVIGMKGIWGIEKHAKIGAKIPVEILSQLNRKLLDDFGVSFVFACEPITGFNSDTKKNENNEDDQLVNVHGLSHPINPKSSDYFIVAKRIAVREHGSTLLEISNRFTDFILEKRFLCLGSVTDQTVDYIRFPGSNIWFEKSLKQSGLIERFSDKIIYESFSKDLGLTLSKLENQKQIKEFEDNMDVVLKKIDRESKSALDRIIDECKGRVFYKNGYFDLPTQRFVSSPEDPTATTFIRIEKDFDQTLFSSFSDDHPVVKQIREKICFVVGGEEDQTYLLRKLARAIGGHFDKVWNVCRGPRNAGKGVLEKICKTVFGDYVTTRSPPLSKDGCSDPGKANKEILTSRLYICRLAFANETASEGQNGQAPKIDGDSMKAQASGGDWVICRKLYENDRALRVTATSFFNMNEVPDIAGNPDCLETLQVINFPYKFESAGNNASDLPTIKKADETIKTWIESDPVIADAFAWMVYKNWRNIPVSHSEVPNSSKLAKEAHTGSVSVTDNHAIFGKYFKHSADPDKFLPVRLILYVFYMSKSGQSVKSKVINDALKDGSKLMKLPVPETRGSKIAKDINAFFKDQGIFGEVRQGKVGSKNLKCLPNIEIKEIKDDNPFESCLYEDDEDDTIDP